MTTYYKVLRRHPDGTLRSCHGGDAVWPEPKKIGYDTWAPGTPVYGHAKSAICSSGIHLTTKPLAWLTVIPAAVFLAEPLGPGRGTNADKTVFDGARLIEPVELPFWWQNVEAFIAEIQSIRWFDNHDAPLPHWKVFESRDAARAAAWDAAGDAAGDAAWDAAGAAALYARVLVCGGLYLAQKHIDHATARMEVWKRGYGLACDIARVLYVYRHP